MYAEDIRRYRLLKWIIKALRLIVKSLKIKFKKKTTSRGLKFFLLKQLNLNLNLLLRFYFHFRKERENSRFCGISECPQNACFYWIKMSANFMDTHTIYDESNLL